MNYRPIGFQPVTPWGMPYSRPAAQDPVQGPAGVPSQMPTATPAGAKPASMVFTPAQAPATAAPMAAQNSQSNCFGSQDLDFLRMDLRGELEAINQYWSHIAAAKDPRVKELLCRIMNDEKHHYAEVTALIRELDPYQDQQFEGVEKEGH